MPFYHPAKGRASLATNYASEALPFKRESAPVSLFPAFYFQCRIWCLLLFFHVVAAVYEFRLQQHYAAAFLDFFGGHAGIELGCEFIKTDAATL